jgi:flagellar basal body rod protein FlgG
MDPLTAIAASGLRARMESLEMLANNVANAATGGFKADREFYSLYVSPDQESTSVMPIIERPWTDQSQGVLTATGNPLDVALSGRGFFAVDGPSGPLYTRNGSFHLTKDGRLVTQEGYALRTAGSSNLVLRGSGPVEIARDGTVRQDGLEIGRLEVADFTSTAGLVKQGNTYFRAGDASTAPLPAPNVSVEQGQLENSNAGSAEAAVRLISVMRQFEMLQKAVSLGADMNERAIRDVARVGA